MQIIEITRTLTQAVVYFIISSLIFMFGIGNLCQCIFAWATPGLHVLYYFCRAAEKLFGFLFSNGFSLYMYLSLLLSVIFSDVSCYSTVMEILVYFRFCDCPQKSATCTVTHFISSIFLSSLWAFGHVAKK